MIRDQAKTASTLIEVFNEFDQIRRSVSSYLEKTDEDWLFRGVSDEASRLTPRLLRLEGGGDEGDEYYDLEECQIRSDVLNRGASFLPDRVIDDWSLMYIMQHHGFPTRLLDWTGSLSNAAYFATRDPATSGKDGAIWILESQRLNQSVFGSAASFFWREDPDIQRFGFNRTPRSSEDMEWLRSRPAVTVFPGHVTNRIIAQMGRFTVHNFDADGLEARAEEVTSEAGDMRPFLHMIRIPAASKELIRRQAAMFGGAEEANLFPDLDGLARGLKPMIHWLRKYC